MTYVRWQIDEYYADQPDCSVISNFQQSYEPNVPFRFMRSNKQYNNNNNENSEK